MKRLAFGILCMAGCVLLMSHNSFAASGSRDYTSAQGAYGYYIGGSYGRNVSFNGNLPQELITGSTTQDKALFGVVVNYSGINNIITDTDQYHTITWRYNLSASNSNILWEYNESKVPITLSETMGGSTTNFTDKCNYVLSGNDLGVVCSRNYSQGQRPTRVAITIGRTGIFTFGTDTSLGYSFHNTSSPYVGATIKLASVSMSWTSSGIDNSAVIDGINNIDNKLDEQFDKENAAVDNIGNQQPPSSGSGENSTTTNLIGVLSSFVSALSGLSATDCNLTLDFPSYAGGTRVVNICQNKDKAGNLISVFSSLTLIVFYVPLAIKLLTMIYNEIRSFTNG